MIFVTCVALFLWGTTYAVIVAKWLPRLKRLIPGATALAVVVGVLPIIGALALSDGLEAAGRLLLYFVCAGLAMIAGSVAEAFEQERKVSDVAKDIIEKVTDE